MRICGAGFLGLLGFSFCFAFCLDGVFWEDFVHVKIASYLRRRIRCLNPVIIGIIKPNRRRRNLLLFPQKIPSLLSPYPSQSPRSCTFMKSRCNIRQIRTKQTAKLITLLYKRYKGLLWIRLRINCRFQQANWTWGFKSARGEAHIADFLSKWAVCKFLNMSESVVLDENLDESYEPT